MLSARCRAAFSLLLAVSAGAGCRSGSGGHPGVEPRPQAQAEPIIDDPLVNLLRSRANGLVVLRTSSGEIAVQLQHGPTTFYGSNAPLYLVDDMPFRPGANGELIGINPYDIESIKALTKPEETTLYGVRGANGVIVITMKKPGKSL